MEQKLYFDQYIRQASVSVSSEARSILADFLFNARNK